MSASNVTPLRAAAKRPARARNVKAAAPNVLLLEQAADLMFFVTKVYEQAAFSDLHEVVVIARDLVQRWFDGHEELDLSDELYDAMGLLTMADMAFEAALQCTSSSSDPFRATLNAARDLLSRAVDKPTEAS